MRNTALVAVVAFLDCADRWLLDRVFEPLTRRIQSLTGLDCFSMARGSTALLALGAIALAAYCFTHQRMEGAFWAVAIAFIGFFLRGNVQSQEKDFRDLQSESPHIRNPYAANLHMSTIRIIAAGSILILSVILVLVWALLKMPPDVLICIQLLHLMWMAAYFSSCTPVPKDQTTFSKK